MKGVSPFTDDEGIIRVGGRIRKAKISFENKHPIILSRESPLSRLIVSYHHDVVKHQGRTITLGAIRLAGYFICGGRKLVDIFLKQCTICQRLRGKPFQPIMSDLPEDRLECSPVFTYTGMDLFGPYNVSEGVSTRKNSSTKKVWGLIFVCMTTRAIHLETVGGLDVCSFRNALRRFFCYQRSMFSTQK